MRKQNTEKISAQLRLTRLLFLFAVLVLWCVHAVSLWSGSLWFLFTRMGLCVAELLLGFSVFRIFQEDCEGVRRPSFIARFTPYSTLLVLWLFITLCWLLSPLSNIIKDHGMRHRIQTVSDEAKLQDWAKQILQTPIDRLPVRHHYENDKVYVLDDRNFPDYVRRIPMTEYRDYCYFLIDEGSRGRYLEISMWHNRPEWWGVLLCPPTYNPMGLKDRWLRRWKPGMYGWQQLNTPPD